MAAAAIFACNPPVTSCEAVFVRKIALCDSFPERVTRSSRMRTAPSSDGGRSKIPRTSVRNTARRGVRCWQSDMRSASPLTIPLPASRSRTASPWSTGTIPLCRQRSTSAKMSFSPKKLSPRLDIRGKGCMAAGASPLSMSAPRTS
eukprot:6210858-Pleurochrysis_carterae.AAC.1